MRHLKKSVTDKVTLFYCYFDSEHPRCTWVVVNGDIDLYGLYIVLVPTIHVGCSEWRYRPIRFVYCFSTHDTRGL